MNPSLDRTSYVVPALLKDATAAQALAVLGDIARALREPPVAWIPGITAEPYRQARGASLAEGRAGLALFYAYLHRSGLEIADIDAAGLAEQYLTEAWETLARVPMPLGLMRGCAGVLWTARHVAGLLDLEEPGPLDLAEEYLGYPVAKDGFDLWQGIVGHGVYALEGLPAPGAAHLLADIVDRLAAVSVRDENGLIWLTHPAYLKPAARRLRTQPFHDLGAAHGQACVMAFLARVHAAGVEVEVTGRLAAEAVNRFLTLTADGDQGRFVPGRDPVDGNPVMGMETWCNGTPGAAAALLLTGECCGEAAWRDEAIGLARDAALRARRLETRSDASLCHGAAGEALLWRHFHLVTGEDLFAETARIWYRRTLDRQRPGEGVGGYVALGFDNHGDVVEVHEPGLLQGAAGVGLALMVGMGVANLDWTRVLQITTGDGSSRPQSKDDTA